jgi:hypothetical protein
MTFLGYPFGNRCRSISHILNASFMLSPGLTHLLFLLRVYGVYECSRRIALVFGLMWILVVASTSVAFTSLGFERQADSLYCIVDRVEWYSCAPYVAVLIYDTLVFVAISYKLYTILPVAQDTRKRHRWKFLRGELLTNCSRMLLQDGQSYYWYVISLSLYLLLLARRSQVLTLR